MARLVIHEGAQEGEVFPVERGVTIGRDRHNAICMPQNRRASRDHAKVWKEGPGRYAVVDLGSTNGTLVNERKVTRASLEDGDLVRVGDVVFRFELDEEEAPKASRPAPAPADAPRPDLGSLLRGEVKPARPPAPAPGAGVAGGAEALKIKERVLQYHKKSRRGTTLGWDLSQAAGPMRWILLLVALAVAAGAFLLVRGLVLESRQAAEEPPYEAPPED